MKASSVFAILLALIAFGCIAAAQEAPTSPVAVTGKVLSLELESNETWELAYFANVELRFLNLSRRPVIIPKRDPIWFENVYWPSNDGGEFRFDGSETAQCCLFSEIRQPVAVGDKTVLLSPGDVYVTHSRVRLSFDRPEHGEPEDQFYPRSLHASLELTLKNFDDVIASPKDGSAVYELGRDELQQYLRKKWAGLGDLLTEDIETEPIDIALPPPPPVPEPSGLVLRGSVTSISLRDEDKHNVMFEAGLHLEFTNTGKKPVIILKPESTGYHRYPLGFVGVMADPKATGKDRYLSVSSAWPSISRGIEADAQRKSMDQIKPPVDQFWIVPPGGSQSLPASTSLVFDKKRESYRFPPTKAVWSEIAQIKDLWLVVAIQVWPHAIIENSSFEFGRGLRSRWADFGVLELGENGVMTSEPMPFTLPVSNEDVAQPVKESQ